VLLATMSNRAAHSAEDYEAQAVAHDTSWSYYGGDSAGTRYSSATQIDRRNVNRLQLAWSFRTGASQESTNLIRKAAFEATPILADDKVFLITPYSHVLAVDAASGHKLGIRCRVDLKQDYSEVTSRGVSVWLDTQAKVHQACRLRVFAGTLDARLFALDAQSGKQCRDFGAHGAVDLTRDVALAQD
jgi:quinoprotein glucose dehydrogenase